MLRIVNASHIRKVIKLRFFAPFEIFANVDQPLAIDSHRNLIEKLECFANRFTKLFFQLFDDCVPTRVRGFRSFFFFLDGRFWSSRRSG